ncbi:reverse transcriptase domain-containing protein [Tanacetum coccineum]
MVSGEVNNGRVLMTLGLAMDPVRSWMVTTCRNSDDDVPNFEAMITAAVANALPNLTAALRTQITNDIRNAAAFSVCATTAEAEDWEFSHLGEVISSSWVCPENFQDSFLYLMLLFVRYEQSSLSVSMGRLDRQPRIPRILGSTWRGTLDWIVLLELLTGLETPGGKTRNFQSWGLKKWVFEGSTGERANRRTRVVMTRVSMSKGSSGQSVEIGSVRIGAAKTSGTITGILYIDDRTVFVLFDTRATHSIISTTFAKKLNMTPTPLIERIIISTPMKNHMLIDHEYVNCPLRFDDRVRPANLLPIHMFDFDVILWHGLVGFSSSYY